MDYALIRKIFLDCFRIDSIDYERTRILTLAHDNDRSFLRNGKYYSPLIDTLEDDLAKRGERCVSVARIISSIKGDLSYGNARSPEGHFARALVVKRLLGRLKRGAYPYSGMEEVTWGKILDRTQARYVVGILPSRELCTAARKRGVWVADVQHGVIADQHPWYGEKFRAQDPIEHLPHAFLCWDPGSEAVTRKWAQPRGILTHAIGNRWIARFMRPAADDALVREVSADFARESFSVPGKQTILVSLSAGDFNIPNGFVPPGLEAVIHRTSAEFNWVIRLHPNQLKGFATHESRLFFRYFEKSLEGHARWEVVTRYPLPLILRHIDLHVSWSSSVCIEAAQFGIRSALMNPRLRTKDDCDAYYDHYRRAGMIDFIEDTDAVVEDWIRRNIALRKHPEDYARFDREYERLLDFLSPQPQAARAVS